MLTYHYDEAQDDEGNDGTEEDDIGEDAAVVPRQFVVTVAAAATVSPVVIVEAVVWEIVRETRSRNYQHNFLLCVLLLRQCRHFCAVHELTATLG